jgi:hypothetical protein
VPDQDDIYGYIADAIENDTGIRPSDSSISKALKVKNPKQYEGASKIAQDEEAPIELKRFAIFDKNGKRIAQGVAKDLTEFKEDFKRILESHPGAVSKEVEHFEKIEGDVKWQLIVEGRGMVNFNAPDDKNEATNIAISKFNIDPEKERFNIERIASIKIADENIQVGDTIEAIEDDLKIGVKKGMKGIVESIDGEYAMKAYMTRLPDGRLVRIHFSVARKKASIKTADGINDLGRSIEGVADSLVRYTYNKLMEQDPKQFVNFVIGAFVESPTAKIKEAESIVRDFDGGAPWITSDKEFEDLIKLYKAVKQKSGLKGSVKIAEAKQEDIMACEGKYKLSEEICKMMIEQGLIQTPVTRTSGSIKKADEPIKYKLTTVDGEVSYKEDMTLEEMQKFVGGYIEIHGWNIINEEGLLKGLPQNKIYPFYVGNVIENLSHRWKEASAKIAFEFPKAFGWINESNHLHYISEEDAKIIKEKEKYYENKAEWPDETSFWMWWRGHRGSGYGVRIRDMQEINGMMIVYEYFTPTIWEKKWEVLDKSSGEVLESFASEEDAISFAKSKEASIKIGQRTVGKENIKKIKQYMLEGFDKGKEGGGVIRDFVMDKIRDEAEEMFDTWEGAYNEIENIIDENYLDILHKSREKYPWRTSSKKTAEEEKVCKTCGKPLSSSDYGWYCSNQECPEYDKDILEYEASVKTADEQGYMITWREQYIDNDPKEMAEKNANTLRKILSEQGLVPEEGALFGAGSVSYELGDELPGLVKFSLSTNNKKAFIDAFNSFYSMNRGDVIQDLIDFTVPDLEIVDGKWSKAEEWIKQNEQAPALEPSTANVKKGAFDWIDPDTISIGETIKTEYGPAKVVAVRTWAEQEADLKKGYSKEDFEALKNRIQFFLGDVNKYYDVIIHYEDGNVDQLDWSEYSAIKKGKNSSSKRADYTEPKPLWVGKSYNEGADLICPVCKKVMHPMSKEYQREEFSTLYECETCGEVYYPFLKIDSKTDSPVERTEWQASIKQATSDYIMIKSEGKNSKIYRNQDSKFIFEKEVKSWNDIPQVFAIITKTPEEFDKLPNEIDEETIDKWVGAVKTNIKTFANSSSKKQAYEIIPPELQSLAQQAKNKTIEEFTELLGESGERTMSGNEKLALILGRPVKFGQIAKDLNLVSEIEHKGIPIKWDIGGISAIALDYDLTNYLKKNPQILADFYNLAKKTAGIKKASHPFFKTEQEAIENTEKLNKTLEAGGTGKFFVLEVKEPPRLPYKWTNYYGKTRAEAIQEFEKRHSMKVGSIKIAKMTLTPEEEKLDPTEFLEAPFGLKGKEVIITGGDYKGNKGIILQEIGYMENLGVVCRVRLESGYIGSWDHSFFEVIDEEPLEASKKGTIKTFAGIKKGQKEYFWQDLPEEIKNECWDSLLKSSEVANEPHKEEVADDLINRCNTPKTISEWQEFCVLPRE